MNEKHFQKSQKAEDIKIASKISVMKLNISCCAYGDLKIPHSISWLVKSCRNETMYDIHSVHRREVINTFFVHP